MQDNTEVSEGFSPDAGMPILDVSASVPVSPTSLSPEQIAEVSKSLLPMIEDTIERKFKSTTDKRFSKLDKLEKKEVVMTELLATLKSQGATIPAEVERQYAVNDYIDQRIAERMVPRPTDNGMSAEVAKTEGQFDALSVLKTYGLESNDPLVPGLMSGRYKSVDHFELEVARAVAKKTAKPASSQASMPPLTGGVSSTSMTEVEKNAAYAKLNNLYKTPSASAVEIAELEKSLGMA
jgi:hypothetical protein